MVDLRWASRNPLACSRGITRSGSDGGRQTGYAVHHHADGVEQRRTSCVRDGADIPWYASAALSISGPLGPSGTDADAMTGTFANPQASPVRRRDPKVLSQDHTPLRGIWLAIGARNLLTRSSGRARKVEARLSTHCRQRCGFGTRGRRPLTERRSFWTSGDARAREETAWLALRSLLAELRHGSDADRAGFNRLQPRQAPRELKTIAAPASRSCHAAAGWLLRSAQPLSP